MASKSWMPPPTRIGRDVRHVLGLDHREVSSATLSHDFV
jgi:hypothetical protein